MATRIDNDITLSHEDAEKLATVLNDLAAKEMAHARTSKSEAVRAHCIDKASWARVMSNQIVRELWTWTDDQPALSAVEG